MNLIEAEIRAAVIAVLSDMLAGLTEGSTNVREARSAAKPPEVVSASVPDEPEWGGLGGFAPRGELADPKEEGWHPAEEAAQYAARTQPFRPIGNAEAQSFGPAMSVRDLLSRLEKADKVPAAAGWAKRKFGTGSFKNLSDTQRGAVAVAFHVG